MAVKQKSLEISSFAEATIGILVANKCGEIVLVNRFCCDLFGYHIDKLQSLKVEDLIPTSYRHGHENYREGYHKDPKPRAMGMHRELYGLKSDGSKFPLEISLSSTLINGEQFALAYVTDATEKKQMLEELNQLNEKLENKVEARTNELESTVNELLETNHKLEQSQALLQASFDKEKELGELKSRFVSMASHEFRTPLSTILSSASLISKYEKTEQQSNRDKHIARIKTSVRHLTQILNDFLSLSKIEEGKEKCEYITVNCRELCSEIMDSVANMTGANQELLLNYSLGEDQIVTDPKILKNILYNLISNAIKYSGENAQIFLDVSETPEELHFKVMDNGIGIPEPDHKHMFQRFFRASNVENIQGTGLGLNIVKRYVELMKGTISFVSKLGEGTTFKVILNKNNG